MATTAFRRAAGVEQDPLAAALAGVMKSFEGEGLRGEIVYRTLKAAIVRNVLPASTRLQDRVLAEALGVSRTPVREALQRLEGDGFVENVPRLGWVVADITSQDVEDIYVIRIALEGVAAGLAAQRASGDEVEMLLRIHQLIAAATERQDLHALEDLNRRFHDTIYRATRNRRLATLLGTLHESVQRFRRSTLADPIRAREALDEHRQIIEAIRDRDHARAEALARRHKERAKLVRLSSLNTPSY